MKFTQWLLVPFVACCLTLTGCGPDKGTTVIEGETLSEEEREKADENYDDQYESDYENYDDGQ